MIKIKYSPQLLSSINHQKNYHLSVKNHQQQSQSYFSSLLSKNPQPKDQPQGLQLIEILKLEKQKDYIKRISQIVELFQLKPVTLNLSDSQKHQIISKIVCEDYLIKQTDSIILKNYEVINYKSKLYTASQIILKKYPSSNFQKDSFDMIAYSMKGEVLSSFHNFKKIDRLIKALFLKFRRLQNIFFLENVQKREFSLDNFLQIKKSLNLKSRIIGIYNIQNHENFQRSNQGMRNMLHYQQKAQIRINDQPKTFQEYKQFSLLQSITCLFPEKLNNEEIPFQRYFREICQTITKKQNYDRLILEFICFRNQKKIKFTTKNQITIKLINYCHQKLLESQKNLQEVTISQVKQILISLIQEIQESRIKLQNLSQNKQTMIQKHFPRLMKRGARLCFHCKQKSRYLCIGCSVKHSNKVVLCVLCFAPFHVQETYREHFPSIIKKSNSKFIPNIQKQVSYENHNKKNTKERGRNESQQEPQLNSQRYIDNENIPNRKKIIKKQTRNMFQKYILMKQFVADQYKKIEVEQQKLQNSQNSCKLEAQ